MLLILVFISSLLHSADMLQCLECTGSSCQNPASVTCAANQACAVYQTDVNTTTGPRSSSFIIRSCFPTELCLGMNTDSSSATASVGLPFVTGAVSVSCCTTDNCNTANLTAPSNAVNGLKCSSCTSVEDKVCNTTLSCVGNQDRCFYDTVSSLPVDLGLGNKILKGCVSKNLCGPSSFFGKLNCCEGNLCNQKLKNLQCLQCSGSSCQQPSSGTCPANQACAVSRIVVNSSDSSSSDLQRSCLTPELCLGTNSSTATASVGFAFRKTTASVSCCTTDDCNGGSLPEASNAANGLKCASCKSPTDTKCNTILPCVGVQDRCFNDSVSSLPVYFGITNGATLKGCVSKNLCGSSSTIGKLNCCEGTLCNKVENLQCRKCVDAACLNSSLTTCASNQLCVVSRTDITTSAGSTPVVLQDCLSAATCLGVNADNSIAAASVGLGFLSATVNLSCCSEDGCNNGSLSAPSNATNGLKCATCSSLTDKQCNTLLSCVGVQDRCFNESVLSLPFTFGIPGNVTLKGCVSKNLCGPSSIGKLTCCEGNLCNKSTTWLRDFNIGLLLMSLITAVFLQ